MVRLLICLAVLFLFDLLVSASPLQPSVLDRRQLMTTLTSAQVSAFKPYSYYASAGYCEPSTTLTWTCVPCQANPVFKPLGSGGDGGDVQFWYVGYDPSLDTIIVGHQGTDSSKILPIITDLDFFLTDLDSSLFPGIDSTVQVHSGFKESQADTATEVLSLVKTAMSKYSTTSVAVVGHSLGGAIALLDGVYLDLQLPMASVSVISYGMPRVGNQAFADYVDAHVNVSHVNNKRDPVPILPGRFLGFHHCSGEKHITDSNAWVACPGQDNEDRLCTVGEVSNILVGDALDHDGPYDGVTMVC
ncbi:alpha/beta-hydrolase [Guyanagaster necrorhizus]|uniref:Alpha/beta-hydrolase n=1 Tax=Guyanagaster necrorhizus TaxID=856835 RepID=A0A9P7VPR9_9AGAR|nr:alpha/beta-hydrolase [Guyanagaster necrorhizus MCA 3950]KAG7445156.1 alpha/beta-hydrolase [Guyanagaster necrorhizus MCA 3950]